MPNIMICGFDHSRAEELKACIDAQMQALGLGGDAITSIVETVAEMCDGYRTSSPYLRICSTDTEEIKKIIRALQIIGCGVDVEWLVLDGFISGIDMLTASANKPLYFEGFWGDELIGEMIEAVYKNIPLEIILPQDEFRRLKDGGLEEFKESVGGKVSDCLSLIENWPTANGVQPILLVAGSPS